MLTAPRVRALLAAHDLHPDRRLGQHYLVDPNTARRIPRLAGVVPGETVLEVGPGLGSLTLALREAGCDVVAVEADRRLLAPLAEVLAGEAGGVRVEHGDALRVDLAALAPAARKLVANLPYSIAAPLVLRVLAEFPQFASLTVMVQREVGERLAAPPGSAAYGAPSAKLAALASVRLLGPVSRHVFLPAPHVDSLLVGIQRQPHPALERVGYQAVARVIDAAFSQRRKTLRNALRPLGLGPEQAEAVARAAGIDPASRAERLDVAAFAALAEAVAAR
jgi:16S rRNA (adenine1518-N6/adenine1519-N6)-dimethyltransferase